LKEEKVVGKSEEIKKKIYEALPLAHIYFSKMYRYHRHLTIDLEQSWLFSRF